MKLRTLTLLFAATLTLAVSACNSGQTSDNAQATTEQTATVKAVHITKAEFLEKVMN